jgi:hypothetical protein
MLIVIVIIPETSFEQFQQVTRSFEGPGEVMMSIVCIDCEYNHYKEAADRPILILDR